LLDWLEAKDRLIAGDVQEPEYIDAEQEIPELMAVEDVTYDIEDEDEGYTRVVTVIVEAKSSSNLSFNFSGTSLLVLLVVKCNGAD